MKKLSLYLGERQISDQLFVCQNFYERARGLLWRDPLRASEGEALLIRDCNSVHTLFMKYTIDLIFLDRQGTITSIRRQLKPWRAAADFSACQVIECPEESSWTRQLMVGQTLSAVDAKADADAEALVPSGQ